MKFKKKELRFDDKDLEHGSLCVVKMDDSNYCQTGYALAYYDKGSFYDTEAIENPDMRHEHWTMLDDVITSYCFIGINVFEEIRKRDNHLYN